MGHRDQGGKHQDRVSGPSRWGEDGDVVEWGRRVLLKRVWVGRVFKPQTQHVVLARYPRDEVKQRRDFRRSIAGVRGDRQSPRRVERGRVCRNGQAVNKGKCLTDFASYRRCSNW
jgi:hypothetical protein